MLQVHSAQMINRERSKQSHKFSLISSDLLEPIRVSLSLNQWSQVTAWWPPRRGRDSRREEEIDPWIWNSQAHLSRYYFKKLWFTVTQKLQSSTQKYYRSSANRTPSVHCPRWHSRVIPQFLAKEASEKGGGLTACTAHQ